MIELRDVCYSYGNGRGVEALSCAFAPGTLCGIVGPNGSGKSTAIRLLGGLLRAERGDVFLDGRSIRSLSRRECAKLVSLFPQSRPVPRMTVEELVTCGRFPYGGFSARLTAADRLAVEEALQTTGLQDKRHRAVWELSGGERQLAYLSMLFAQDTPYLLLDEPTAFLDAAGRFDLMERLLCMRDKGKCVIAVLHDLPLALRYCDRLFVMNEGRLCWSGTSDAFAASGLSEQIFGVQCHPVLLPSGKQFVLTV